MPLSSTILQSGLQFISNMTFNDETKSRPLRWAAKKCGLSCHAARLNSPKTRQGTAGASAHTTNNLHGPVRMSGIRRNTPAADHRSPSLRQPKHVRIGAGLLR